MHLERPWRPKRPQFLAAVSRDPCLFEQSRGWLESRGWPGNDFAGLVRVRPEPAMGGHIPVSKFTPRPALRQGHKRLGCFRLPVSGSEKSRAWPELQFAEQPARRGITSGKST